MPNWCSCDLKVSLLRVSNMKKTVQAEMFKKFVDGLNASQNEHGVVALFATYVPTPPELESVIKGGGTTEDGQHVEQWREGEGGKVIPLSAEETKALLEKYGATDWYDWNIRNLGTKWYDCETRMEVYGGTRAVLSFDTAWTPPQEGIRKISGMFPLLRFSLKYYEGGNGFQGSCTCIAGEIVRESNADYRGHRGG